MKTNRFILLLTISLIALQGMGVIRTLHNFTHHCPDALSTQVHDHNHAHQGADHDSHESTTKQAPNLPSDPSDDTPQDPSNDEECDLCLTLNSLSTPLSEPTQLPIQSLTYQQRLPISSSIIHPIELPRDIAARAPPRA